MWQMAPGQSNNQRLAGPVGRERGRRSEVSRDCRPFRRRGLCSAVIAVAALRRCRGARPVRYGVMGQVNGRPATDSARWTAAGNAAISRRKAVNLRMSRCCEATDTSLRELELSADFQGRGLRYPHLLKKRANSGAITVSYEGDTRPRGRGSGSVGCVYLEMSKRDGRD
ncbi:hypothetical protein PYCCODRAFT_335455 [Trametes coccinea BRFM310]|uniref:Uncharacterized protein n=1 Tax=Trametes coccinea (strain BRFM310) TaxID=1353009 RepID=A0A1Y2IRZ4_TRAC3|nr:hypothetical protein PYCCODRAFT_335455 [Trametes coccinea BRFM310]